MVALVRVGAGGSGALLCPAHRHALERIASLGRLGSNYFSAIGTRKAGCDLFPRFMVRAIRTTQPQAAFWICSSACNPQPANCACAGRSRLGNNGFDWNSGVCDNVRCRDKSFVAWCGVARCFGVSSTCCNPNLRTNGATLRVSSPAEFQRRCWFATDAGVDRLGQRRNGRAWLGQRSTEDALSALCAYRFYFPNCW